MRKLIRLFSVRAVVASGTAVLLLASTGCEWRGVNGLPLPGTEGSGPGAYSVEIQLPNVNGIAHNSRVRVNDVTVGNVSDIAVQGWHALVTVRLDGNAVLPKNATAKVGQTSLLGTLHIELASPVSMAPEGRLADGDLIPLENGGAYPTTEQTLSALSVVLNGGGVDRLQEINNELGEAFSGREDTVRALLANLDEFSRGLSDQRNDVVAAMEGLNTLAATVNEQNAVLDRGLASIPEGLKVLNEQKTSINDALVAVGNFADQSNQVVATSRQDVVDNLHNLAPVFQALAASGPDLPRSLGLLATYPWPENGVRKFIRGDYANLSAVIDLTLGRLDDSFLTGTPYEGQWSAFELMLGRTVGINPRPGTNNPLTNPLGGGSR